MNKLNKISSLILASLVIFLVIMHGVKYFMVGNIKYTYATNITTYDDIDTSGIFIREEILIEKSTSDLTYMLIESGDKVARGDDIALNYSDEKYLELNEKLVMLKEEEKLLKSITVVNQNQSEGTKTAILINNQIANLNQSLDDSNIEKSDGIIEDIKNMSLKSSYSQMSKDEISMRNAELKAEIESTKNLIDNHISTVKSNDSGYFIGGTDGYEDVSMDDIDVSYMEDLENKNITLNTDEFGKIITDFNWTLAVLVDTIQVEQMEDASRLRIHLENISDKEIPVEIIEVKKEGDKSVVFLQGDFTSQEILEARTTDVKIILREHSGIKIPKESTRVKEGVLGVYSLRGHQAVFKKIEPIFEKDDYYLIESNNTAIIIGDKIITESKQLDENQIVK